MYGQGGGAAGSARSSSASLGCLEWPRCRKKEALPASMPRSAAEGICPGADRLDEWPQNGGDARCKRPAAAGSARASSASLTRDAGPWLLPRLPGVASRLEKKSSACLDPPLPCRRRLPLSRSPQILDDCVNGLDFESSTKHCALRLAQRFLHLRPMKWLVQIAYFTLTFTNSFCASEKPVTENEHV